MVIFGQEFVEGYEHANAYIVIIIIVGRKRWNPKIIGRNIQKIPLPDKSIDIEIHYPRFPEKKGTSSSKKSTDKCRAFLMSLSDIEWDESLSSCTTSWQ